MNKLELRNKNTIGNSSALRRFWLNQRRQWQLYLLVLLPVIHLLVFAYWPMYGVQIAFKNYRADLGIWGSEFVGMRHFVRFLNSYQFGRVVRNTFSIGFAALFFGFPVPLIFAVMLNELHNPRMKKTIQLVSYAPYFISVTVLVGMLNAFLDVRSGPINQLLVLLGRTPISFTSDPKLFLSIYTISGIWQTMGYSAVVYLAALSGVDQELYEAAYIDGSSRLQKIIHIDLPSIAPTVVILLILSTGQILSVGYEKAFLMQNNLNLEKSEIIATYVYKVGLVNVQYSFSAAIGLLNSVVNFTFLFFTNTIAKKLSGTGLF